MTADILIVFGVLLATIALFIADWLRLDLVAIMALLALLLAGILTPAEALAGFADPLVIIIAGLFVVGAGLFHTGVANHLASWLGRVAGESPLRLTALIMMVVALLSAFLSSTGTVAILLPAVMTLAGRAKLSPSKLLIPLAFASLLGGMLTLIGTPANIVVSQTLSASGQEPFGFFAFTPIGLVMLVLGLAFMLFVGRHLLPDRNPPTAGQASPRLADEVSVADLAASYGLPGNLFLLRIKPNSPLVGDTVAEAKIGAGYQVTILELRCHKEGEAAVIRSPAVVTDFVAGKDILHAGDELLVHGLPGAVAKMCEEQKVENLSGREPDGQEVEITGAIAEVLLPPRSRLIGKTLKELRFRDRYDLTVLSILRLGRPVQDELSDLRLKFGDTLLVDGTWPRIRTLRRELRDFVVIAEPPGGSEENGQRKRAWVSVAIMVAMLILMTTGLVPTVVAILLAAVAMVLSRCLTVNDAYGSMSWESLILIAAMLPMATALNKTGGMELVVGALTSSLGELGPYAMMTALFVLTSVFSQFISNTATAVLVAPIALQAAIDMQVSPRTFLITVAIAASTAFATPIASPVNTLVLTPGGYRFTDFSKVGLMMVVMLLIATVILAPVFFPFG